MMQMTTAKIKRPGKEAGIAGLLEGYEEQPVETAGRIEVADGGCNYGQLLVKLEEYLDLTDREEYIAANTVLETLDSKLTPEQINSFLQDTIALDHHTTYLTDTGRFISKLIQNSYNEGNYEFTLNLEKMPALPQIGIDIKGKAENPIVITITGKTGSNCALRAEHCTFNTEVTGEGYGQRASNCTFNAEETGEYCGYQSSNCTFNTKEAGDNYGNDAKNCTFTAEETGRDCGGNAKKCTFKTSNPETLQQMLTDVSEGNQIIFIDDKGDEKVMREYDEPRNRD